MNEENNGYVMVFNGDNFTPPGKFGHLAMSSDVSDSDDCQGSIGISEIEPGTPQSITGSPSQPSDSSSLRDTLEFQFS